MSAPLCRHCRQPRRKRTGQAGWAGARGYCQPCYERARDAGFPAVVPDRGPRRTDRWAAARALQSEIRASRVEEYGLLRRLGVPVTAAGARAGVSQSTAYRYEGELRDRRRVRAA